MFLCFFETSVTITSPSLLFFCISTGWWLRVFITCTILKMAIAYTVYGDCARHLSMALNHHDKHANQIEAFVIPMAALDIVLLQVLFSSLSCNLVDSLYFQNPVFTKLFAIIYLNVAFLKQKQAYFCNDIHRKTAKISVGSCSYMPITTFLF